MHCRVECLVAGVGHMGGAVEQCLIRIIEWTFDGESFERIRFEAELIGQRCGKSGTGEHRGCSRPHNIGEQAADIDGSDTQHRVLLGALDPGDLTGADLGDPVDVVDERGGRLDGTELPGADIAAAVVRYGSERGHCRFEPVAGKAEHAGRITIHSPAQPSSAFIGDGGTPLGSEIVDAGDDRRVGEDRSDGARQRSEPPAGEIDPGGGGDGVLQLMRLIDHHDLVLGKECTTGGEVHPVQMGVHDDDIGFHCCRTGSLGEAFVAFRAPRGAGAFARSDTHCSPGPM